LPKLFAVKNPPGWSATFLGLAVSITVTFSVAARGEDRAAASSKAEKESPHLLLANVWDPSIDPTGWWMSEKYDGLRGYWDGRQLWSRKGKLIHAPDYFLAELPRDIALDGELWIGRGQFEETTSTVLSETPDARWKSVHFMVFDAPQAKGTFEERMQFLQATLPKRNRFAKVVAQVRCKGTVQLLVERDRIVGLGGEGLMLRQPESEYEPARSPTLLKVKLYDDAEATVVAHQLGEGKFAGKLGSLRVRTDDGKEFSIGSGFTDAQRESPPSVGTVITYRFRGLTAKGLPRFPSYLRVRRD
jgi:DNA ligase-1